MRREAQEIFLTTTSYLIVSYILSRTIIVRTSYHTTFTTQDRISYNIRGKYFASESLSVVFRAKLILLEVADVEEEQN